MAALGLVPAKSLRAPNALVRSSHLEAVDLLASDRVYKLPVD